MVADRTLGGARRRANGAAPAEAPVGSEGASKGCMPCRGTGKVLATTDGEPKPVTCPWCEGTGERVVAVDAQARWREGAAPAAADTPDAQSD
jgi:hypothetical protein